MFAFLHEGELGHKRLPSVGNLSVCISELLLSYYDLVALEQPEDFLKIPAYGLQMNVSSYEGSGQYPF